MNALRIEKRGREASWQHPCPHCGANGWCVGFADGGWNCYRSNSGLPRLDRQGSSYSYYPPDTAAAAPRKPWVAVVEVPAAPLSVLDQAYRVILDHLTLSPSHKQHLIEQRGLPEWFVDQQGFRSAPCRMVADATAQAVARAIPLDWRRVPGLRAWDNGAPHLWWGGEGIILPCRNPAGRVQALLLRRDKPENRSGKYGWFSFKHGASSGAPPAWWHASRDGQAVRICEGSFDACALTLQTGDPVIAASGVGLLASDTVLGWLRVIGPGRVILHPDPDTDTNSNVHHHTHRALQRLRAEHVVSVEPLP